MIPHPGGRGAVKCLRCDGNGIVEDQVVEDHLIEGELPCRACGGSGFVSASAGLVERL